MRRSSRKVLPMCGYRPRALLPMVRKSAIRLKQGYVFNEFRTPNFRMIRWLSEQGRSCDMNAAVGLDMTSRQSNLVIPRLPSGSSR